MAEVKNSMGEKRETVENTLVDLVMLPDACKNFMLGYMIGVQQERRNSEQKKSA